jgi:hypothetical protein
VAQGQLVGERFGSGPGHALRTRKAPGHRSRRLPLPRAARWF